MVTYESSRKPLFWLVLLLAGSALGCHHIRSDAPADELVFPPERAQEEGWYSLFDGDSFEGWTVNERERSFRIVNGMIIADGWRSHLFYTGFVADHAFTNFHFKADVRTTPGSNSGIYFHTVFQEKRWPKQGYEAQVNNTHRDKRKTGSLYGVEDVYEVLINDNEWFAYEIIVQGKTVTIRVNGQTVVSYTEPADPHGRSGIDPGRVLSQGTFALQAHDPWSKVYYANLRIRPL